MQNSQFLKRNKKPYQKLPSKEAETIPWDTLCVDLIRIYQFTQKKYKMTTKSRKSVYLQTVTIIEPGIGWIEIRTALLARANRVANQVELAWLTRY